MSARATLRVMLRLSLWILVAVLCAQTRTNVHKTSLRNQITRGVAHSPGNRRCLPAQPQMAKRRQHRESAGPEGQSDRAGACEWALPERANCPRLECEPYTHSRLDQKMGRTSGASPNNVKAEQYKEFQTRIKVTNQYTAKHYGAGGNCGSPCSSSRALAAAFCSASFLLRPQAGE